MNRTAAIRKAKVSPGDYVLPYAGSAGGGPGRGSMNMGPQLIGWFIYSVVVSVFAGYLAGAALPAGASYLDVFRFAGTTAFAGYALALPQNSIWWKRGRGFTIRSMIDGLVYGCLTAGVFGWLWP